MLPDFLKVLVKFRDSFIKRFLLKNYFYICIIVCRRNLKAFLYEPFE